jgi:hypothetical protein
MGIAKVSTQLVQGRALTNDSVALSAQDPSRKQNWAMSHGKLGHSV